MNNADMSQDENKPLDPVMEKLRRKMLRLLVISIGIMMAGVMALLFAIVYKINNKSSSPPATIAKSSDDVLGTIILPAGAQINSHSFSGNQILLHLTLSDGENEMALFDMNQGRIIAHYTIKRTK